MLNNTLKNIAWAGKEPISRRRPAPRYCDIIAEIALRVWPRIHISIDRNEPTIPTATSDSSPSTGIFPTMAVSVIDKTGSAMPAMVAGMANLFMVWKLTAVLKIDSLLQD